jgi:predicted transcriptional regulator
MSALTIRLPDKVVNEVDQRAQKLHISRSEYIRKSIETMNKSIYEKERSEKLAKISKRVREESMIVNSEFSETEYDSKT